MEAPPSASSGNSFVALADEGATCWHWRAKGSCKFGDACQRKASHGSIDGPPRGLFFMLYKTPREEAPQCLFRRTFAHNGLTRTKDPTLAHLLWANILPTVSGNSQATDENTMMRKLPSTCRVNHFPRSFELTHKDKLYHNLRNYGPLQQDSFLPNSFVLPEEAVVCAREVAAVTEREVRVSEEMRKSLITDRVFPVASGLRSRKDLEKGTLRLGASVAQFSWCVQSRNSSAPKSFVRNTHKSVCLRHPALHLSAPAPAVQPQEV